MRDAFKFSSYQYVWFGGYPGAASLIGDEARWKSYMRDTIIRPSIEQDLLQMTRVDKPALLMQLFELACQYSGQIISLQKLTGHLQDAGNVTTLAHYLQLLSSAGFVSGIQKYSGKAVRMRASPPKMQVHDNGLMNAMSPINFQDLKSNPEQFGRVVESAVGSHLIRLCRKNNLSLHYWRENPDEVDFVVAKGKNTIAIEVKSSLHIQSGYNSLSVFRNKYPKTISLLIGKDGVLNWDEFLLKPDLEWI
jgi:predicted AAA+ superfamily ATPase